MTGHSEPHNITVNEESPLLSGDVRCPAEDDVEEQRAIISNEPSNRRLALILGSIFVGVFLGALDSTIIATLSVPISTSFNSLSLLSWLASAYLISNAICQPLSGKLTDIFSRRTGLLVSNILFAAGNLICGLAQKEWTMIGGRVVSGMGGGSLMTISTIVASDLVPLRKRGVIQGIANTCYGTGAAVGGLFGGWVNDTWGWRVAFLCQVPLVVGSAIIVYFVVDIPSKKSTKSTLLRIDFLGAITLTLTLLLLLLGLNAGGNVVHWSHPLVLTTLPLSVIALFAFVWVEAYWATEPMIPVKLLLNRTVAAACLTTFFTTMGSFMLLFYVPVFFQIQGLSSTRAGMQLIPQTLGASLGSLGVGFAMKKTGRYQGLNIASILALLLGTGLLITLHYPGPGWPSLIYMFLVGSGYGSTLTVTLLAIISAVDHEYQAVVTSAGYAFRSTGSTIGVTIGSAVYQNILNAKLWEKLGAEEGAKDEIQRIRDNFDELHHLPEGWESRVLDSFMDALRGVFLTALVLSTLGLVCALFIRQHVLHTTLARK